MRGEYSSISRWIVRVWELPPRARRIPGAPVDLLDKEGTTSACAENTDVVVSSPSGVWNYLRVRGEYLGGDPELRLSQELPPRARRIRIGQRICMGPCGTTSACAENTQTPLLKQRRTRNYLRVRGEYLIAPLEGGRIMELPPRARRIP